MSEEPEPQLRELFPHYFVASKKRGGYEVRFICGYEKPQEVASFEKKEDAQEYCDIKNKNRTTTPPRQRFYMHSQDIRGDLPYGVYDSAAMSFGKPLALFSMRVYANEFCDELNNKWEEGKKNKSSTTQQGKDAT